MHIKTIHGCFPFVLQRFSQGADYFSLSGQFPAGYSSERLRELVAYYSNRMSYEEVARLLERITGESLLSDQTIWQQVVKKAAAVSQQMKQQVEAVLTTGQVPTVEQKVAIYSAQQPEVLLFDDAIQVKEQKAARDGRAAPKRSRVSTDVVMVERKDGGFRYLTAGIDESGQEIISLEKVVTACLLTEYGARREKLPVVAITDGAKAIRQRLLAIFGVAVTVILDWYHLGKKVRELISMIARNKCERQQQLEYLFKRLWKGQTRAVLKYLSTQVVARNQERLVELISYLEKHRTEIINYERRQKAGKTIGSGRMEKGVDQVIGKRQKEKAMSWSRKGSKALAVLKVAELNGEWEALWNCRPGAA